MPSMRNGRKATGFELGYALSSEEHKPSALVRNAVAAEEAGFDFALVSDHFHPWIDTQGQSGFVWSVLGGIAASTDRLRIGTGVTCPIMRTHPAIIAQAAATVAEMMPGRFFLGVGTGEALNEHITGEYWPRTDIRIEMLEEAIEVIRTLWKGELTNFEGNYFTVENARIYSLPDELPPIYIAASGENAAQLAGRTGDGLISTSTDPEVIRAFESEGNRGPRYGQIGVCWAKTEKEAMRTAHEYWPNTALHGTLTQELALPSQFKDACAHITPEIVAERVVCGPDPKRHLERIEEYAAAGFDHVYIHQIGPDQEGFLRFYTSEVMPVLKGTGAKVKAR